MKKILITIIAGTLLLIAVFYLRFVGNTSTFDSNSLIIGSSCKSIQETIIPILKEKNAVVIVPSKASKEFFNKGGENIFNVKDFLKKESSFLADKLFERNYKKVVIISYQNDFSKIIADSFEEKFEGKIVRVISFVDSTNNISTEIAKIKELDFDAIIITDTAFFTDGISSELKKYEINTPMYTGYVPKLSNTKPFIERLYLRIILVLMEVLALYLNYIKGQERWFELK